MTTVPYKSLQKTVPPIDLDGGIFLSVWASATLMLRHHKITTIPLSAQCGGTNT